MKKENKIKKREEEQEQERQEADRKFKRQGNICLAMVLGCCVVMLLVGRANAGAVWLGNFYLVMGAVIAVAFIYSVRNVTRRLKQMRDEDENRR